MPERPNAGDIFWASESGPSRGHEQQGQRPVLIVTDARLTSFGMCWVVPLSTTERGWPSHVRLSVAGRTSWAMCEQLRSMSLERLGRRAGAVSYETLSEVRSIIREILGR